MTLALVLVERPNKSQTPPPILIKGKGYFWRSLKCPGKFPHCSLPCAFHSRISTWKSSSILQSELTVFKMQADLPPWDRGTKMRTTPPLCLCPASSSSTTPWSLFYSLPGFLSPRSPAPSASGPSQSLFYFECPCPSPRCPLSLCAWLPFSSSGLQLKCLLLRKAVSEFPKGIGMRTSTVMCSHSTLQFSLTALVRGAIVCTYGIVSSIRLVP